MLQPTIVLFDVDSTLLNTGGAGRRALVRTFGGRYNSPNVFDGISFAGRTDPWLFTTALESIGVAPDADLLEQLYQEYLGHLRDEVVRSSEYDILPGVLALLPKVEALGGAQLAMGLGTGNMERGARIKLERGELNGWFDFGGFGSDHLLRPELIRIGAERGASRLGRPLDACHVVVVGDTPLDVSAAHAIGARCIAVATGRHSAAELEEAGAEHVLADLIGDGVAELILGL